MKTILLACAAMLLNVSTYAGDVMIVAHRGASKDAPENTIPAFELAWEQGADAIEADFHLTKDGHIVCIHDRSTGKSTGTNLVVRNVTLADLQKLDVGVRHGDAFRGTHIPTIADVFATIPENKIIYIEIKCGAEIIPALLKEIKKSDLKTEQIVVICFNKTVIQALKAKAPEFKASWLAAIKTDDAGIRSPSLKEVLTILKQINADGLSTSTKSIDEAFIKSVQEHGYDYHVWTVDNPQTANKFKKWGAKSITTNVPGHLRKGLAK